MIIVRVELKSARDGSTTELARMHISNAGSFELSRRIGNYIVQTLRARGSHALDRRVVQREGFVKGHKREALHVWHLVAKALASVGYANGERAADTPASSCSHCGKPSTTTRCGVGGCPIGADL